MGNPRFLRLALSPLLVGAAFAAQAQSVPVAAQAPGHVASHTKAKPVPNLSVQYADLGPVAGPQDIPVKIVSAAPPAPASHPGFEPAPLPNEDIDAPSSGAPKPRLGPALLSRKAEFLGHGFSNASSLDYGAAERRQPAAGVNLLVPVIQ